MPRRRGLLVLSALAIVCSFVLYVSFDKIETRLEVLNLSATTNKVQVILATQPSTNIVTNTPKPICSQGTLMFENYCVISPYQNELKNTSNMGLVTLCTQATVDFLQHVIVLCPRWAAPISVAVYSPAEDYVDARLMVDLLRQCNLCVRYWVNWHFFFLKKDMLKVTEFQQNRNCSSITLPKNSTKRRSHGTYPINVGRNVARRLADTPYIFSSDIELYPSLNIPSKFERMLRSQKTSNDSNGQVWVFPVFEVQDKFRAPMIKSSLREMFVKGQAISFHQYRCIMCHKIPNLTHWINHKNDTQSSELEDFLEPLKVWTTVKRSRRFKLHFWEPFFIGTNKDPEFDIRLSWEGKQNKMQMAYEMCMKNYDFHIIENAFLVHRPGINVYSAAKEKSRSKHTYHNNQVMKMVRKDLIHKYGLKKDC